MIALPLPFQEAPVPQARSEHIRPAPRPVTQTEPPRSSSPQHAAQRREIWLALHLKDWPLHAALSALTAAEREILSEQPLAIVEGERRSTIIACNEVALSMGIRLGHSVNAAIALCAQTQFLPRHPQREVELLDEVAALCQRFTSVVTVQPPNELLLEIRGSRRLFGGLESLMTLIQAELVSGGLRAQLAVSATAQSAQWLARASQQSVVVPQKLIATLSRLPIEVLLWPIEVELRLRRFGVVSVGDLLRLPRGGLARRIGYERLQELDRAVGRSSEIKRTFRAAEQYEDHVNLDFEIETTGLLFILIERRLQRLQRFLQRRDVAIDRLHIELKHHEPPQTTVPVGLANPTADMAHLAHLIKEHLGRLQLPSPVIAVTIRAPKLQRAKGGSGDLFLSKGRELDASVAQARLLEQLQSRLGAQAIRRLQVHEDHRPEYAHHTDAVSLQTITAPNVLPSSPRPLWLLSEAKPIPAQRIRHDNLVGPETIEAGWWDEQLVTRDYYRAHSARGPLGWIYRSHEHPNEWRLHGLFA